MDQNNQEVEEKQEQIVQLNESDLPTLTLQELSQYNGIQNNKVYISLKGIVFDVSNNEFYTPGSGYHVFTGADASYNLAKMSLNKEDLNKPIDTLSEEERQTLEEWFQKYNSKYKKVYKLI